MNSKELLNELVDVIYKRIRFNTIVTYDLVFNDTYLEFYDLICEYLDDEDEPSVVKFEEWKRDYYLREIPTWD